MASPTDGSAVRSNWQLLHNGKIWPGTSESSFVEAIAIQDGEIVATGSNKDLLAKYSSSYQPSEIVDLAGRTVIPGLSDGHLHVIREGLNFNLELRWDGLRTLKAGLDMIREQAARTPAGQWIRVVGGWSELQFEEKRLPTIAELDEVGGGKPVFVLHLYDCALVNRAGLQLLGYNRNTPNPPSGEIVRDAAGEPTGVLIARPNAFLLYNTLNMLPKLNAEQQLNSTVAYIHELNRFGVTAALDPGGGFQRFPDDYSVIQTLDVQKRLNLRIAYSLFPQKPGEELADFQRWSKMIKPGEGSPYFRMWGAGEMLAFSAADFEDFKEPRPDLPSVMEKELETIVRFLVSVGWSFRLHATYGESINRELAVFEKVAKDDPAAWKAINWWIDHAETISDEDIQRIKALGGGVAIQHRMAFQGEYFLQRYGGNATQRAPPLNELVGQNFGQSILPMSGGTDGTRVATYNPWVSIGWLATGHSVGGVNLSPDASKPRNAVSRAQALYLWTQANAVFSREEKTRGTLTPGKRADLAILRRDYFDAAATPDSEIGRVEAAATLLDGRVVFADQRDFAAWANKAPQPIVEPEWSPVNRFGGYQLQGSQAWKRVEDSPAVAAAAAVAASSNAASKSTSAASTDPVKPHEFFEHGHDC